MRTSDGAAESSQSRRSQRASAPAFQIICLASGGGPSEDNVTGFLIRSTATNWAKGSLLTIDAGSHLAAITRLLDPHFPHVSDARIRPKTASDGNASSPVTPVKSETTDDSYSSSTSSSPEPEHRNTTTLSEGPFAGVPFPHTSSRANGIYIVKELVATYLITHPHLDHVSALAINTASFHNSNRPKRVAALPSTVNALKSHIFNQVIWPNLTDEDGGVGFITFQRLSSGGHMAVGEGSGKGYIEVCDGLCVKGMKISHGHCTRGSEVVPQRCSDVGLSEAKLPITRSGSVSVDITDRRRSSISASASAGPAEQDFAPMVGGEAWSREAVVDSTAYFIRDDATKREILFFGDVEPDILSLSPRTTHVWTEAAPKISSGLLRAIFIECSYDDSHADNVLFGHLAPRHLARELQCLADMVRTRRADDVARRAVRKRKHSIADSSGGGGASVSASATASGASTPLAEGQIEAPHQHQHQYQNQDQYQRQHRGRDKRSRLLWEAGNGDFGMGVDSVMGSPRSHPTASPPPRVPNGVGSQDAAATLGPLAGVTVIVIHVKDTLEDGPFVGDRILKQLRGHETRLKEMDGVGLGCEFVISERGGSYWF